MILSLPESSSGQQVPHKKIKDGSSICFHTVILIFLTPAVPKQSFADIFGVFCWLICL